MIGRRFLVKHRSGSLLTVYVLISVVCLLFSGNTLVLRPKELGLSIFSLFQHALSSTVSFVTETVDSIRVLGELKEEHEAALERLRLYEQIERDILTLKDENQRLSEVLDFSTAAPFENIPAKIIGKDPQNYHATITVNRGSLSGISRGMVVIGIQNGQQGLVGKVINVGLTACQVQPLYDPNDFVAARLISSRYEGLVNGSGDEKVMMRYINRYARPEIRYGDIVITSGTDSSLFPEGIQIGTVKSIIARSYETSMELEIAPVIDFSRLEYVYILRTREGMVY